MLSFGSPMHLSYLMWSIDGWAKMIYLLRPDKLALPNMTHACCFQLSSVAGGLVGNEGCGTLSSEIWIPCIVFTKGIAVLKSPQVFHLPKHLNLIGNHHLQVLWHAIFLNNEVWIFAGPFVVVNLEVWHLQRPLPWSMRHSNQRVKRFRRYFAERKGGLMVPW